MRCLFSLLVLLLGTNSKAQWPEQSGSSPERYLDSLYYQCYDYLNSNNALIENCVTNYMGEAAKLNDSLHIAYAWDLMGQQAYIEDKIDSALNYHQRALGFFETGEDLEGLSIAHYNLSKVYSEMGRLDQSLYHIHRYRSIDRMNAMDLSSDLFFFSDLAEIYQGQGAYIFALDILKKYRPLLDSVRFDYPYFEPIYLTQLADCYLEVDSLAQAQALLQQAEYLIGKDSTSATLSYISSVRAQYYLQQKSYEKALNYINLSLVIDSVYGNKYDLALSRIKRAEIRLAKGDLKAAECDLDSANVYLQSRSYRFSGTPEYLQVKQKLDSAQGNFTAAYISAKRLDSLRRKAQMQNYSALLLQMEFEQRERENESLEARNELQTEKLFWRKTLLVALFFIILLLAFFAWREYQLRKGLLTVNTQLAKKNIQFLEQAERRQQQNQLILEKNTKLLKLDQTKNRLLSILSHDLQQPFNQMRQVLELMRGGDEDLSPKFKSILEDLNQSVIQSGEVVRQLLIWTKAQFDGYKVNQQSIVLEAAVKKALLELRFELKAKELSIHLTRLQSATVYFDPDHLRFVLRNLLKNAIKFSPRKSRIVLNSGEEGEKVYLAIEDYGSGIEDSMKERILTGTNQMSGSGSENEKGNGLGLRIVRDFLRENHSDLLIDSKLGEGSSFKIVIPRPPFTNTHGS